MKKVTLIMAIVFAGSVSIHAQQTKKEVAKDHKEAAKEHREEKREARKKINKSDVPADVLTSFTAVNPNVEVVQWGSYPYYWDTDAPISSDTTYEQTEYFYPEFYEVEYVKESKIHKSIFSRNGKLLHTRRLIKDEELPKTVSDAFMNSEYKDWKIVGFKEKIERQEPKEIVYKIIVERGKERHALLFNENGKLVQGKKMKS